jgi:hypothetical protein
VLSSRFNSAVTGAATPFEVAAGMPGSDLHPVFLSSAKCLEEGEAAGLQVGVCSGRLGLALPG